MREFGFLDKIVASYKVPLEQLHPSIWEKLHYKLVFNSILCFENFSTHHEIRLALVLQIGERIKGVLKTKVRPQRP